MVDNEETAMDGLKYVTGASFQKNLSRDANRWDREWLRYFSIHDNYQFYFYDMNTSNYALNLSPSVIAKLSPEEMFESRLLKTYPTHVWVDGADIVGKTVLEMGCGPGFFGRIASRFVKKFIGLDASKLALHIAEVASPGNCSYIHLENIDAITTLTKSVDTCVGRNFFIHHNFDDSLWILKFLRDLTAYGGVISADFYYQIDRVGKDRLHSARDPLNPDHASALYHFEEQDIRDLARAAGLEVTMVSLRPTAERHFALMRVI